MKIVLASRNAHKLMEFRRILEPLGYAVTSQEEVCPGIEVVEDGTTFAQNARKKAVEIFRLTGMPSIADDSGLCVQALDGAPGVYSARYAGAQHSDTHNNAKLLDALRDVPMGERSAYFESAICCVLGAEDIIACEGRCHGSIGFAARGEHGFGYDPLFTVGERSFAELSGEEKDVISHRGVALRLFEEKMRSRA